MTRAASGTCASGGMTVLSATLPWTVLYRSFTGTLPNITGINMAAIGAGIQIREPTFGLICLGRTAAERPLTLSATREAGGSLTTGTAGGTISTSCGVNGTAGGTGNITRLGSSTRIGVSLLTGRGAGDLSITPAPPIAVAAGGTSIRLRLTGLFGTVTITRIDVTLGGEIFRITDGNCVRTTLEWRRRRPRECNFTVSQNAAGMNGRVTIEYTRPEAATKPVEVRS